MNENATPLCGFDVAITTETSIENQGMPLAQISGSGARNRNGMPHLVNSCSGTNRPALVLPGPQDREPEPHAWGGL